MRLRRWLCVTQCFKAAGASSDGIDQNPNRDLTTQSTTEWDLSETFWESWQYSSITGNDLKAKLLSPSFTATASISVDRLMPSPLPIGSLLHLIGLGNNHAP